MTLTLGSILRAALIAGVAASLATAVLHFAATEAVIDQAITLEEEAHAGSSGDMAEPVVSRSGQRVGLLVGLILYGVMWGLLFAVAYHTGRRWLPPLGAAGRGLLLAVLAFWSVALLPFLKYPALPPGVATAAEIGDRQAQYIGILLLSIVSTIVAVAIHVHLVRRYRVRSIGQSLLLLAGLLLVTGLVPQVLLPGQLVEGEPPAALITTFQALSLAGLATFWLVLGLVFAWFMRPIGAVVGRRAEAA